MSNICSVSQLVFPSGDEITVCERNGKLITVKDPALIDAYLDGEVVTYPTVQISLDSLRRTAVIPGESAKTAFLDHKETMMQRLLSAWHENGMIGVLSEVCDDESEQKISPIFKSICHYTIISLRWIAGMHFTLFPHLKLSPTGLISQFSENRDWEESPIRFFSWHHRARKFAIALRDDTVKIHYSEKDTISVLKHRVQKNITCMEWRPLLATHLAVGTQSAILIWCVDPKSHSTRPSSGAVQVLSYKGHAPVSSIAWCPTGDDLLLATSAFSSALVVWSTALEEYQVIQHLTTSGGVSRVVWSPDGSKVVAATPSSSFRVFETGTWTNERWSNLSGYVQCACWNPTGSVLIFALHGDPRVYSVVFPDPQADGPSLSGCSHASLVLDLSEDDAETDRQSEPVPRTNHIHSMAWDDTGRRVAVLFDKADARHNLVAVFSTSYVPLFQIVPIGYVQGPGNAEPVFISFKPNCDLGACLTVCWSDGSINHIPMYIPKSGNNLKFHSRKVLTGAQASSPNLWTSSIID